jgi:hypothetical protein
VEEAAALGRLRVLGGGAAMCSWWERKSKWNVSVKEEEKSRNQRLVHGFLPSQLRRKLKVDTHKFGGCSVAKHQIKPAWLTPG